MRRTGLIILLIWPSLCLADETLAVDQTKLAACLWMKIGKDRLVCYQEATGQIPPLVKHYPRASLAACGEKGSGIEELACLDKLFRYPQPGSLE